MTDTPARWTGRDCWCGHPLTTIDGHSAVCAVFGHHRLDDRCRPAQAPEAWNRRAPFAHLVALVHQADHPDDTRFGAMWERPAA
jgi:hypothetical protein